MGKDLIIFDIDGTLTKTNHIDSIFYTRAIQEIFKINQFNTNWDNYLYSTDTGLLIEICQQHLNKTPDQREISSVREHFFQLLSRSFNNDKNLCQAIPGAGNLLSKLSADQKYDIAIATGGWLNTAILKLKTAKMYQNGIPLASSNDHIERTEIITVAYHRACQQYQEKKYRSVTYVGDKLWDYDAATHLGINFIGVGHDLVKLSNDSMITFDNFLTIEFDEIINSFL